MTLKCIYPQLGPLYYDFMGFDMGFCSFLSSSLFTFLLIFRPQLTRSMKRMKDSELFQKVEGQKAHPPLLKPPFAFSVFFILLYVHAHAQAFTHLACTLLSGY